MRDIYVHRLDFGGAFAPRSLINRSEGKDGKQQKLWLPDESHSFRKRH